MLFAILLIGHLLGDFYLQSAKMAEKKQKSFRILLLHGGIYFFIFILIGTMFITLEYAALAALIIALSHFIIDLARTKIDNKAKSATVRFGLFLTDQILHIGILTLTYYLLHLSSHGSMLYGKCMIYSGFNSIVLYGLLFTVLLEPSAVFIKKIFSFLFRNDVENSASNNAGSVIGKLERIIMATLLLCGQYSVMGFVLTAKSIARFKQLEEKNFAEKYLIGTLTSLAISLIATLIIKTMV